MGAFEVNAQETVKLIFIFLKDTLFLLAQVPYCVIRKIIAHFLSMVSEVYQMTRGFRSLKQSIRCQLSWEAALCELLYF